jgi:predicted MFS family arabinose efflux permease
MIDENPPGIGAPVAALRQRTGFWLVAAVYALVMLGGTLPIPLYTLWAPEFGFGPFTTTLVFAVYSMGTVLALTMFASLSDRVGRRPMLVTALLLATASTALFLVARDVPILLAARFLYGLSTGVFTATATAALNELAGGQKPRRTSIVSTAANLGGLGLGTITAGLFGRYAVDPTHLVFWVFLVSLAPALLAILITPETVAVRHRPTLSVRRPTLPDQGAGRSEFLRAAVAIFAAFAVNGLFSSLVPSFLRNGLHVRDIAAIGGAVALLFLVGLVAQVATPTRWLDLRWLAPAFLVAGVGVFEVGLWTRSLPTFVIGTLLAGTGIGLTFRHGVAVTQRLADPARRADLLSTYFLIAYAGTIIPTLTLGVLDQVLNQDLATLLLAVVVGVLTLAVASGRRTPRPLDTPVTTASAYRLTAPLTKTH